MENPAIQISAEGLRIILEALVGKGNISVIADILQKSSGPEDINSPEVDRIVREYYASTADERNSEAGTNTPRQSKRKGGFRTPVPQNEIDAAYMIIKEFDRPASAREIGLKMIEKGYANWGENSSAPSNKLRSLISRGLINKTMLGYEVIKQEGDE